MIEPLLLMEKYACMIDDAVLHSKGYITIDYKDLHTDIATHLCNNPDSFIQKMNEEVAAHTGTKLTVRIGNNPTVKGLREITVDVVNKLISVPALVVRTSEVKPLATKASYKCIECNTLNEGKTVGFVLLKPNKCVECKESAFELDIENCEFVNLQIVRLQELPEDLPAGQLPDYIDVTILDELVDNCRPGDRVILTGIVRIEQENTKSSIFTLRMEGNNVEYVGGSRVNSLEITPEDEQDILALKDSPDLIEKLIGSFAPHIFGLEVMKESILLLIVGSVARKVGNSRRGDINVFMIGDPGLAKSELLKFAATVAPRGLYTSGRGVTAAGLTAAVTKQDEMMVLEAGAVVLGDQGIVCIDEMDKIKDTDRAALHEVMEQQTCSVAKGGIVATLNARTSILAAANPNSGSYDITKTVAENIAPLPVPLLTRFDIIHIMRDTKDLNNDTKIANHIIKDMENASESVIQIELLRKYLAYAKKIEPKLSSNAANLLAEYYLKMRNIDSEGLMTVTPRQLEGLVRIATARARLLLKDHVDIEDAERAIYLATKSLESIGIDIETGKASAIKEVELSKPELFLKVFKEQKYPVQAAVLITALVRTGKFSEFEAQKFIQAAKQRMELYEPHSGEYMPY